MSDRYHFNGYPDQLNTAVSLLRTARQALYNPEDRSENETEIKEITRFLHILKVKGFIN